MRPVVRPPQYAAPSESGDLQASPRSQDMADFRVTALSGLVTLTFDFSTLELVARTTFLPILVFLRLFFVELGAKTSQTIDVKL